MCVMNSVTFIAGAVIDGAAKLKDTGTLIKVALGDKQRLVFCSNMLQTE